MIFRFLQFSCTKPQIFDKPPRKMLKKLCLFQIIILTLRHKNKKLVSIMAKTERQKRIYRKRIPYGMQNFEDVIKEDCYFVDKTPFIENIEESNKYFFFIRPRRFGKSLTISMLENYYDINKKDQFESLFGKLYITFATIMIFLIACWKPTSASITTRFACSSATTRSFPTMRASYRIL